MNKFSALVFLSMTVSTGGTFGQLAADNCKFLGNIIGDGTPADFLHLWNQVTPENAGKWGSVEPTRDQMAWSGLDNAYNLSTNNGLLFKHHTLVWGQQQPAWMSNLSAEDQKAEVEEWIAAYCNRYPATDFIDVVNEPLHAPPSYMNALGDRGQPAGTGWSGRSKKPGSIVRMLSCFSTITTSSAMRSRPIAISTSSIS
ncbi:MAG TPA: endo-1,4-beta-xylanase [Chryseosolibacter sp.]|nr:endo-1,4-beta-xylanase [Chryseosolibacter sp.]